MYGSLQTRLHNDNDNNNNSCLVGEGIIGWKMKKEVGHTDIINNNSKMEIFQVLITG